MPGFTRTVVIDRPVQAVFDFATDLGHAAEWMPSITKTEMLTEGGMKPGAKFRETRRMGKKERSAIIEVLEHTSPEVHTGRSAMLGMAATYRFRFTPEGPGTRVTLDADVRGNLLWKLFLGMFCKMMEKEDGEILNRLKHAVESH